MLGGRTPTQRAVGPLRVVALPPLFDDLAGVGQAPKPVDIEAFVAELAIEALQVAVLHRPPRLDEIQLDVVFVGPDVERLPGELGAVIQRDPLGGAVPEEELLQQPHYPLAGQRRVDVDREALARDDIEHIEGAEAASVAEHVVHEVHRPRLPRLPGYCSRSPRRTRHALALPLADRQPFQPIEPLDAFAIDAPQLALEQQMEAPIAPPWSLRRERAQAFTHGWLVAADPPLIAHGAPMCTHEPARPTLGHAIGLLQMAHRFALSSGRYQFFRVISFSAVLSRVKSATICLRRRFSSSNCRNRRSWLTSNPPYWAFQR